MVHYQNSFRPCIKLNAGSDKKIKRTKEKACIKKFNHAKEKISLKIKKR